MSNTLSGGIAGLYFSSQNPPRQLAGMIAGVATVNVADPAALADGIISTLSIDATGRLRVVLSGTAPVTTIAVQPVRTDDTVAPASTRTVAPGAGTILITSTPAAGTYLVDVLASYDGAVAAAEINNLEVRRGGVVFQSPLLVPSVANFIQKYSFRIALSGAQAFDVRNIGAGTAAVGYNVAIYLNRLI